MIFSKYIPALFLMVIITGAASAAELSPTPDPSDGRPPAGADPPGQAGAANSKAAPITSDKKPAALLPGDYALSMPIDGVKRTVFLHVPPAYQPGKALPLVLLLHGQGGSATGIYAYTGMGDKADKAPFILACPAAMGEPPAWAVGFNSGMHDNSDIRFLGALIDRLQVMLTVDPDRVFVAGHSSGGMMAYRLASELPEKIAAIGVVAGTIGAWDQYGKLTMIHQPARPVSVIAFHGTADPTNPYARGDDWAYNRNFVPAVESAAYWARVDGCSGAPQRSIFSKGSVIKDAYPVGKDGAEVVFYSIEDGDHWWPGDKADAAYIAPADESISATDEIWDFFAHHGRVKKAVVEGK